MSSFTSSLSRRDQMSDDWRVRENANIAFTIQQLPLTGVGLGQEYLVEQSPPPLPPAFTYWRYITHNALLWLWLKNIPHTSSQTQVLIITETGGKLGVRARSLVVIDYEDWKELHG